MLFKVRKYDIDYQGDYEILTLQEFFDMYPDDFVMTTSEGVRKFMTHLEIGDMIGLEYNHYINLRIRRIKDISTKKIKL